MLLAGAIACSSEQQGNTTKPDAGSPVTRTSMESQPALQMPAATSGGAVAAKSGSGGAGGTSGSGGIRGTAGSTTSATMTAGSSASTTMPVTAAGAGGGAGAQAQPACQHCMAYGAPKQTGTVQASELSALSGVAVSRAQPDIFFAHNDHDRPVVYALDQQGRLHAQLALTAAQTSDIEDIAVGQCDGETCVYLADIGDNAAQRADYSILRFVAPEVPSAPGSMSLEPSFEQLRFRYEDGSHNAESLLVAPDGTLYIITKLAPGSGGNVEAAGPSSVYRIDAAAFRESTAAMAHKVTTLSVPQRGEPALSAAAAHPCGLGFLVRTYDRVYEFLVPPAAEFEAAFSATPTIVAMPDEPQSEGIDYLADGRGFVTSGEGAGAPILITQCAP
ncbi:MAG TPA: hypothetical protein VFN67_08700 [Polyangiales bacterium]|nr:hypothetical protein [Polyangiales bacterium]